MVGWIDARMVQTQVTGRMKDLVTCETLIKEQMTEEFCEYDKQQRGKTDPALQKDTVLMQLRSRGCLFVWLHVCTSP